MNQRFLYLGAAVLLSFSAWAQKVDDLLGVWWNAEKDGQVEIYKA